MFLHLLPLALAPLALGNALMLAQGRVAPDSLLCFTTGAVVLHADGSMSPLEILDPYATDGSSFDPANPPPWRWADCQRQGVI